MEKTSLREPIRSATFTGPSAGTVWPDSRPNLPLIATRILDDSRHKKKHGNTRRATLREPSGWVRDGCVQESSGQALAASPRIISYRPVTTATPTHAAHSSLPPPHLPHLHNTS